MQSPCTTPAVAIACGGTGGHVFPGLAVGKELTQRGCDVTLLVSPKEVDQLALRGVVSRRAGGRSGLEAGPEAVKAAGGMDVATLPAVGLTHGGWFRFLRGFCQSYWFARKLFQARPPHAVLAMGGFTSVPPVEAGQKLGAATFLHESNTIPGKANRWLSRKVGQAFVGFPAAAFRLRTRHTLATGTPVRPQFHPRDAAVCRAALGLETQRPVLLVMGGSQGASAINELILQMLPQLALRGVGSGPEADQAPEWQLIHLAGSKDADKVRQACAALELKAVVHPFLDTMELALGAATVAVNRAGASSLAELAAMRVPSILVPLPTAADNHQFYNARAFEETGAACLLEQRNATPEILMRLILELAENGEMRGRMQAALEGWHYPRAAEQIADSMMKSITNKLRTTGRVSASSPERPTARRATPAVIRNHQTALT